MGCGGEKGESVVGGGGGGGQREEVKGGGEEYGQVQKERGDQKDEQRIVLFTYTVIDPFAMMVKPLDTPVA